jgi:hypothetical protein
VAVEKLVFPKSAKTDFRQDDLGVTFTRRVGIFHPQI